MNGGKCGAVTNAETDGRLRANRNNPNRPKPMPDPNRIPMAQGRVKHPDTDMRLKKNRRNFK